MKALAFNEFGGPEKLKLQDVPDPKIGPEDVLVRVRACALNHLDLFVREGIPALKTPLPFWTGCDIAGDVAEIGAEVQGVKVGDRVAVNPNLTCGRCEFCIQGEDSCCVRYGILGEHLPGGMAELVNVRGDHVLTLPAHTWKQSLRALKKGGRLVTCGATTGPIGETDIRIVFWNQIHIIGSTMGTRKDFNDVMRLLFAGRLRAIVDEVVPLSEGAAAQQRLAEGRQFGKIVLRV
jgi:NADPH:quinone reductase-like Zn-dependent oxidoreductase